MLSTKSELYSFDHEVQLNSEGLEIRFAKDSNFPEDNFKVQTVCVFMLGLKN